LAQANLSSAPFRARAMKQHRVVLFLVCGCFAELVCASSRNDAISEVRGQLEASAQAGQSTSLLAIMRKLQRHGVANAAVTSEVQLERQSFSGQTSHERQLLQDMGKLESQLESWKSAEQNLEMTVQEQAVTVNSLKEHEAQAVRDEQAASSVWWDCKMLLCLACTVTLAYCVYTSSKELKEDCGFMKNPTAEVTATPTMPKRRVQKEFIEKDAQPEAEDNILVVTWPDAPEADIEAPMVIKQAEDVWQKTLPTPLRDETTPATTPRSESSSKCQYFDLAEEAVENAKHEEAWWNESADIEAPRVIKQADDVWQGY